MLIGYARTSTTGQDAGLEAQIRDLGAVGCDCVVSEQISSVAQRPQFEKAVAALKPGDTLVVTKIDRFARSNADFWRMVEQINAKGAFLRILNLGGETIDTKSATGRLILTVFAGFAQFEREIMLERQAEGIAKAKLEGKYKGRKPTSRAKTSKVLEMNARGLTRSEISRKLGISRASVIGIIQTAERN